MSGESKVTAGRTTIPRQTLTVRRLQVQKKSWSKLSSRIYTLKSALPVDRRSNPSNVRCVVASEALAGPQSTSPYLSATGLTLTAPPASHGPMRPAPEGKPDRHGRKERRDRTACRSLSPI